MTVFRRNLLKMLLAFTLFHSSLTLPRCGETFNVATGGIFYKAFEPILDNERCVWVIASPGASGYEINVQFLGPPTNVPGSGQEMSITGVKYGATYEPTLNTEVPTSTGILTIDECNIAIVTFHSSQLNGSASTGFALQFTALDDKNITRSSALSTHSLLESPHFDIKYPAGATYQPYELATLVFPPKNNIFDGRQKRVWYKRTTLEGDLCNDSLFLYNFQVSDLDGTGNWEPTGRICGNTTQHLISHDDMVLSIFQSDAINQFAGFYFSFVAC